jgi:hypothetical protein
VQKHKGRDKSLFVYDIEGSLVHEFYYYTEADNELGVPLTNINLFIKTGKPRRNKFLFTD